MNTGDVTRPDVAAAPRIQREIVLVTVLAIAAMGAFQFTRMVADWERRATERDAAAWYTIGARQLAAGHVGDAVDALRHATTRDRANRIYETTLARALVAAGQSDDATVALLELRDSAPDDPQTNVELARLAASREDLAEAARYYRSALYGVWNPDQRDARVRLHVEFIRFLLAHRQPTVALAELLALIPNLPDDVGAHVEAGELLRSAGDAVRARDQFVRALATDPRNREALAGAGEAAFSNGDYLAARRYLSRLTDPSPHVADLRDLSALIVASDPLAPGLPSPVRQQRLVAAFAQAMRRVEACRAGATSEMTARLNAVRDEAAAFEPKLTRNALRASPDLIETGSELVYRLEQEAARACGAPLGLDDALLINGRRHGAQPQ